MTDAYTLEFRDGCCQEQKLPKGIIFGNYRDLCKQFNTFEHSGNGFLLFVPANSKPKKPIHISCICENALNLRNIVIMEARSTADLLIDCKTFSDEPCNDLTNVILGQSSVLGMIRLQSDANINTETDVQQAAYSSMKLHYINMRAGTVRNSLKVTLADVKAEHIASGLTFSQQSKHVDNNVQIIHASPDCQSDQLFKHILADSSTGVFTGRIVVDKNSHKTVAYQRSSNILLNPEAKMNIQPQLEIYADDVKCSHGATVGQLDAEALFYLRSRGIGENQAKKILLQAFAGEVVNKISCKILKNIILQAVNENFLQ